MLSLLANAYTPAKVLYEDVSSQEARQYGKVRTHIALYCRNLILYVSIILLFPRSIHHQQHPLDPIPIQMRDM